MSQSDSDEQGNVSASGSRAAAELLQMLAEGRSYSGREPHCCFLNTGEDPRAGGRFATVSAASGLDFPDDGRAAAAVDWDHDGDLDLWITNRNAPRLRLMQNNTRQSSAESGREGHHFISLQLAGNGQTTQYHPAKALTGLYQGTNEQAGRWQTCP